MNTFRKYLIAGIIPLFIVLFTSCEKNAEVKKVNYFVKGISSEYKVTYLDRGNTKSEVINGEDFSFTFLADPGEVLYFDVKYKDELNKMSGFATVITVDGKLLKESYGYDLKWADSATVNIPYPFEVILSGTVPY